MRYTIVVTSHLAWRRVRGEAATLKRHGLQALTIDGVAARLAGGFLQPIDPEALKLAVGNATPLDLGELDRIKTLPGFARAVATSLSNAWSAGLNLKELAATSDTSAKSRLEALVLLEAEILRQLPHYMRRPTDLVSLALARLHHAAALFGPIAIEGRTEMSPVWRPLLAGLTRVTDVSWVAGPRHVPTWLSEMGLTLLQAPPQSPEVRTETCASPRHEALEAMRWARALISSGRARPEEIAISAASPEEWDDHLLALTDMSGLSLHFVHGRKVLTTREGQLTAALAELLLRGFSQARMTRLVALLRTQNPAFEVIPSGWARALPEAAPLLDATSWHAVLASLRDSGMDPAAVDRLTELVDTLAHGLKQAGTIGEALLKSRSAAIWRKALTEGPPEALDVTLAGLRLPDETAQESAILWAHAASLAAEPRAYVRLIGLTSRAWPRRQSEDALLPDHIVPASRLDPLPVHEADRRDFETILKTTRVEVVCSHARRDAQGRMNGVSPLFPKLLPVHRQRARIPEHAVAEADRLFARPAEFQTGATARSALECWIDWHTDKLTPHDGLMRRDHPLVAVALARRQSATSLAKLVRDPLGYFWTYGFNWTAPQESEEPLQLDPVAFGNLLHLTLERTVTNLERTISGGLGAAKQEAIAAALDAALDGVACLWEQTMPVPPPVLWRRKLQDVRSLALAALSFREDPLEGQRSWAEIPFGGDSRAAALLPETLATLPWDPLLPVVIPGTNVAIGGAIDRLDLSGTGTSARVTDYKGGRPPGRRQKPNLKGGAELQRCLYGFAVRSLLPGTNEVEARLLYPRGEESGLYLLDDPGAVLEELAGFVAAAQLHAQAGDLLPGAGAADSFNDLAFALPGGAKESYFELKSPLVAERLKNLAPLWELE